MIDKFISNVKTRGLARTNRFQVFINFPSVVNRYTPVLTNLFCEVAGLPGYNVATQPHKMIGESREVPYEPMYDQMSLTFYMDSRFEIKDAFETWMFYIIDPITKTHGYYNTYAKEITIYVENIDGSMPYYVTLYEAYPKSMQTVTLDNNSKEVMRMTIGLAYKYWRSNSSRPNITSPIPVEDSSTQGNSGYRR